jgi:hypothetical protein
MTLRVVSRKNLIWPFFDVKMRQNGFFFRNLNEKLGEKNVMGNFFYWSYGTQIWGQKRTHTKIDHFTKIGPKSSKLSIFHRGKAENYEN